MKRIIKLITGKLAAGRKTESPEQLGKSYSLYDTADACPLHVYISALCDNELSKLVIKGKADNELLSYTLASLTAEFSVLSGGAKVSSINNSLRKIYLQKADVNMLMLAYHMIVAKDFRCLDELKNHGIRIKSISSDEELDKALRLIKSKIAERSIRLSEEEKRYADLTKHNGKAAKPGKVTTQDFNDQISIISKHIGFHINKNIITLAEYASYVKQFNSSIKNGKH